MMLTRLTNSFVLRHVIYVLFISDSSNKMLNEAHYLKKNNAKASRIKEDANPNHCIYT